MKTPIAINGEIWKDIPGFNGRYSVSNMGRIWSFESMRLSRVVKKGYPYVGITLKSESGKLRSYRPHNLVTLAFLGPRSEGFEVNHKNGNKLDNRLENLEYCTHTENLIHSYQVLKRTSTPGQSHARAILKDENILQIVHMSKEGFSTKEIAGKFGVKPNSIIGILLKKSWKHIDREKISPGKIGAVKTSERNIEKAIIMLESGMSVKDTASKIGLSTSGLFQSKKSKRWNKIKERMGK